MVNISIGENTLTLHNFSPLSKTLKIPLQHILGAEVEPKEVYTYGHLPLEPQVIEQPSLYGDQRILWSVHNPEQTIGIYLADEEYHKLVIDVQEPFDTVGGIQRALSFLLR